MAIAVASLTACGVPQEEHRALHQELEEARSELQAATERISSLEGELAELRETDEGQWMEILQLEEAEQWESVRRAVEQFAERWPDSSYSERALELRERATNEIAAGVLADAQQAIRQERFEFAKATLEKIRQSYPGTPAAAKVASELDSMARRLEEQRLRALGSGQWRVATKTSPIDDSQNVHLSLEAGNTISDGFGRQARPTLWLRCKENTTEVYLDWGVYLGIDRTRVIHRIDDLRAREQTWHISTDHDATFYPRNDIAFIKELLGHDRLFAQTIPYGENAVNVTFSLPGLQSAIGQLREACHW